MMETVTNSSTGNRRHAVQLCRFNFLNAYCCMFGCQLCRKTTCMLRFNKLAKVSTSTQLHWRLLSNLQAGDNIYSGKHAWIPICFLIHTLSTNAPMPTMFMFD